MVKNTKKKIIVAIVTTLLLSFAYTRIANATTIDNQHLTELNEDSYKIVIDLKNKTADVDGEEQKLSDTIGLDNKTVDNLIKNNQLAKVLDEQLFGDIKQTANTLTIYNHYSLNAILVSIKDESELDKYPAITSRQAISNGYILRFNNAKDTKDTYDTLLKNPNVTNIALDSQTKTSAVDTNAHWGVTATGADHYTDWLNITNGGKVIVAVLDSGINKNHTAFENSGRILINQHALNYSVDGTPTTNITDGNGHGTAVAGTIFYATPSNIKILPIKVMSDDGRGSFLDTISALDDLSTNHAADIVNMSIGIEMTDDFINKNILLPNGTSTSTYEYYESSLQKFKQNGLIMVAAAGNECQFGKHINNNTGSVENIACLSEISYPAASEYTMGVSSIAKTEDLGNIESLITLCGTSYQNQYDWLNYICKNNLLQSENDEYVFDIQYSNHGSKVDFSMPGSFLMLPTVCSAEDSSTSGCSTSDNGYFDEMSGTSFASPMLAAAAALAKSENKNASYSDVYNSLKNSAVDLGKSGKDEFYGWGMVDFGAKMFATPRITASSPTDTWKQSDKITVKAVSSSKIDSYHISTNLYTPTSWVLVPGNTNFSFTATPKNNGIYSAWVRNADGKTASIKITEDHIDAITPKITNQISASEITSDSVTLSTTVSDIDSGLAKVTWTHKDASGNSMTTVQNYQNSTDIKNISLTIKYLQPDTKYTVYFDATDQAGNTSRSNTFSFTTKSATTTPTPQPTQTIKNGIYIIRNANDKNKVLDISGGSTADSANLQIYQNNNSAAQKFIIRAKSGGYYEIENLRSRKIVEVQGGSKKAGANVLQYSSNGSCAQRWKIIDVGNGYYTFQNKCSKLVLDVHGGKTANKTNVGLYTKNGTNAQKFSLKTVETLPETDAISGNTYVIHASSRNSRVFNIQGGKKTDKANLEIYLNNNSRAEYFYVTAIGNGFYRIRNSNSGKSLDVSGGNDSDGTNVAQYSWNGTIAQQWLIKDLGNNQYEIISRCNMKRLNIAGGKANDAANINIMSKNNTAAQIFKLEKK